MGYAAAVVIAAASSAQQAKDQKELAREQARAQERRNRLEQRRADVSTARERAKQVRLARQQRAAALAQAQSGEGTGGSGLAATQANIGSQVGSNVQFLGANQQISKQLSDLNISTTNRQARIKGRIATAGAVQRVATSAAGAMG